MQLGVVLMDFGGPQGPDELVPFLTELLADVLPGPVALLASWIAGRRAAVIGTEYAAIGWSPLVPTHMRQAEALRAELGPDGPPLASAMMFTEPKPLGALEHLRDQGVDGLIAVPMFPHYSFATTQAAYSMLYGAMEAAGCADMPVHWVPAYYEHPDYLDAVAATIRAGVADTPGDGPVHLVFSPHGLPVSFVRRGDPYPDQIRSTVRQVVARMGWDGPWHLGWQSRVGPAKWLTPSTIEVLQQLGSEGVRRVTVVPVSFASDHIETLYELDVQVAELARAAGIEHYGRAPALGTQPAFVRCLADLIRGALQQPAAYHCVRCLHPRPDAHRRRPSCPNCRMQTPRYLRESRSH